MPHIARGQEKQGSEGRTGADHALREPELLYSRVRVAALLLVVGLDLRVRHGDVVLRELGEPVQLLEQQVEDVQPGWDKW